MTDKQIGIHEFNFNDFDGNDLVSIITKFWDNGDGGKPDYFTQEIWLNAKNNSVTIDLCQMLFTPDTLRKLANELESKINYVANLNVPVRKRKKRA